VLIREIKKIGKRKPEPRVKAMKQQYDYPSAWQTARGGDPALSCTKKGNGKRRRERTKKNASRPRGGKNGGKGKRPSVGKTTSREVFLHRLKKEGKRKKTWKKKQRGRKTKREPSGRGPLPAEGE